ncbi:MAG: hypothetical protein ABGY75_11600, partial [Gemmataceae bacterium]
RELAERSYLSVIASQRLDSSLWQAWDIFTGDHNELLEARAVWYGREISHFHHRPQLHFKPTGISCFAESAEAYTFGLDHAGRVMLWAVSECFRRAMNGPARNRRRNRSRFHLVRVAAESFDPANRLTPRVYTARSLAAVRDEIGQQSFHIRFLEQRDLRLVFLWLWRVACDGQRPGTTSPFSRWEHRPGSRSPTVSFNYDGNLVFRAL